MQEIFAGKLKLVESKLEFLHQMKSDISRVTEILNSCRCCEHSTLLDSEECSKCRSMPRKQQIPELFNILLQRYP